MKIMFDQDPTDIIRVADMKHAEATVRANGDWDISLVLLDDEDKPIRRWIKSMYDKAIETPVDSTTEQDFEIVMGTGPNGPGLDGCEIRL